MLYLPIVVMTVMAYSNAPGKDHCRFVGYSPYSIEAFDSKAYVTDRQYLIQKQVLFYAMVPVERNNALEGDFHYGTNQY